VAKRVCDSSTRSTLAERTQGHRIRKRLSPCSRSRQTMLNERNRATTASRPVLLVGRCRTKQICSNRQGPIVMNERVTHWPATGTTLLNMLLLSASSMAADSATACRSLTRASLGRVDD
jgi:hypothetical protein